MSDLTGRSRPAWDGHVLQFSWAGDVRNVSLLVVIGVNTSLGRQAPHPPPSSPRCTLHGFSRSSI